MAMARSSRPASSLLCRIAASWGPSRVAAAAAPSSPSSCSSAPPPISQHFVFFIARYASRPLVSPHPFLGSSPSGIALTGWHFSKLTAAPAPSGMWVSMRPYSKRPKKWQGGPHAYIQVEPGAPCPPYSPNAGSVKKRKHNKRMAQRHAFAKAQAHQRKQETKAAVIKRDAARRKRWREATARARAWAKHLQQKEAAPIAFLGGVFAGLLRLDLNEESLKEWMAKTAEAAGIATEEPEPAFSDDAPKEIHID